MTSHMISDTTKRYGDFYPQCLSSQLGNFAYSAIKPDGSARPQVIITAAAGLAVVKFDNLNFYKKKKKCVKKIQDLLVIGGRGDRAL